MASQVLIKVEHAILVEAAIEFADNLLINIRNDLNNVAIERSFNMAAAGFVTEFVFCVAAFTPMKG